MQVASLDPRRRPTGAAARADARGSGRRGDAAGAWHAWHAARDVDETQVAVAPQTGDAGSLAPLAPQPAVDASGFRWPVRGRIISGFGKKPNGERNDGINLAVPEGTSVKAAEDGTVIYAGNELKSYGNLVLIRHANGWVSAYAHNSKLEVKRGDQVRRGQVIALSGMSGRRDHPAGAFRAQEGRDAGRSAAASDGNLSGTPTHPQASVCRRSGPAIHSQAEPYLQRRTEWMLRSHLPGMTIGLRQPVQPDAFPPGKILHELPGDAAGAAAARRRPFERFSGATRPPPPECRSAST